jgi:membrane protease YdiL (CAAX protease family)
MREPYEYEPVRFFGLAIAWSWTCWAISAVLAAEGGRAGLAFFFNALGLLAPLVAVLLVVYTSGSPALKRDFADRLVNLRRIDPRYLPATLLIPPVVMALALGLSLLVGESTDQFALSGPLDQLLGLVVLAFVLAPAIEELGWRGYGMDSLRARSGLLRASIGFGVLWSVWHAPLVLIKGTYHYELAHMESVVPLVNFFVSVVAISVFVSWLYYKHGRSIAAGILLHSVLNASAVLPDATQTTKCIVTVLYVALSVAVVLREREMFDEGPRSFV